MIENRSAPLGTIVPSLIYNDVGKAIDWLCDVFGFKERLRITGDDGKVGHAQLATGMGGVLLGVARKDEDVEFRPPRAGEINETLSVHVADVDKHYEHAKQRSARIVSPPTTYPYGERQYSVEDLEGRRWTFSQTTADVDPESWGAKPANLQGAILRLPRPRLCYLEINAIDVNRSSEFYEKVFDWNIRHRNTGRPSFDDATGYVSGAWVTGREASRSPGVLPYIHVDAIDETLNRVEKYGGEIVDDCHLDSPGGEWIATFLDPAGNLIGLYQEHFQ